MFPRPDVQLNFIMYWLQTPQSLLSCTTAIYQIPMAPIENQHVFRISNCLENLKPVGTVTFYDVPTNDCGFEAINVSRSTYKWFDADYVAFHFRKTKLNPILRTLLKLVALKYILATFRIVPVVQNPPVQVWKVRIYAIPLDIDGARYIRLWRNYYKVALTAKQFENLWLELIAVIDFSAESWNTSSNVGFCLLPFLATHNSTKSNGSALENHHIQRWFRRKGYLASPETHASLESLVESVYDLLHLPDLSPYEQKHTGSSKLGIAVAEDYIAKTLNSYKNGEDIIKGLKSKLYPFQLRSLCKMYEKETIKKKDVVPNFVKLTTPTGQPYYYDTLNPGIYGHPELYFLPCGGILAENMGFGKTLICLALVLFSKHEVSIALADMAPVLNFNSNNVPTLQQVCVESITRNSLPWQYYKDELSAAVIQKIASLPAKFKILRYDEPNSAKLRRSRVVPNELELYLCSTTLIITPENLMHQWNDEVRKHFDSGCLKVLCISDRFKEQIVTDNSLHTNTISSVNAVISYDLVIISSPSLTRNSKIRHILEQVYWKRLIVDEGHSMNSKSSTHSSKVAALHAERRWAVTGTPTSGLTNLYMNEKSDSAQNPEAIDSSQKFVVKSKFNARDDLVKLGNLVAQYFRIEPFHTQSKLWNSSIIRGLIGTSSFATLLSLSNLLNSIMIRHSQNDIEKDLQLPNLFHTATFLKPSYHNRLSINLFTAVLAVNAISSERVGQDYMFDIKNRPQLRQLIRNLQFASFYWTGFSVEDAELLTQVIHETYKKLEKVKDAKSDMDMKLLHSSLQAAQEALSSESWRMASPSHEMQYFVEDLPPWIGALLAIDPSKSPDIFAAPHLKTVQRFYYKNRFVNPENNQKFIEGYLNDVKQFWTQYEEASLKNSHSKISNQEKVDPKSILAGTNDVPHYKENHKAQESLNTFNTLNSKDAHINAADMKRFRTAQLLGTASTKLSYLSCKLVGHFQDGIKSIVFFDNEDTAYFLLELLETLGVPFILYAHFIGTEQRANNLKTFANHNSSEGGISLIMDLNLASHGLTITCATHVYFTSPIWKRSIEAQAIKRTHRIGQTKDVHVETLILKGTLEEKMYSIRSKNSSDSPEDKLSSSSAEPQSVIDDDDIQNFIKEYKFLSADNHECEYAKFQVSDTNKAEKRRNDSCAEDEFSLLDHFSKLEKILTGTPLENSRVWHMMLFSRGNLQNIDAAGREKLSSHDLNLELVNPVQKEVIRDESNKPRKRVKF
ncbi:hypothetical protein PUMCH_000270 [Australozyma saopauloensis]|uniref:Helicase C-terminal domain-containing protein n=1 Tax=Australozyma saopauloensis TaxID=291208 RepID=A0AAX4H4D1_9ASCO|nr:hypothetical protein PUMCH_000270 [[Candida] saopauloensis]